MGKSSFFFFFFLEIQMVSQAWQNLTDVTESGTVDIIWQNLAGMGSPINFQKSLLWLPL